MGRVNKRGAARSLKRRWALRVFLPTAVCIAAAAAAFAVYALLTLEKGRTAAALFSVCAGAAFTAASAVSVFTVPAVAAADAVVSV